MAGPTFDPVKYYSDYPSRVILRPGYSDRASFKSSLSWQLFGLNSDYGSGAGPVPRWSKWRV